MAYSDSRYIGVPKLVQVVSSVVTVVGDITVQSGIILVRISGETIQLQSGTTVISQISGQTLQLQSSTIVRLPDTQIVKISGETVSITSGQTVQLPDTQAVKVSGETVSITSGTGIVKVSIHEGNVQAEVDSNGGLAIIDWAHHKVHDGVGFTAVHPLADTDTTSGNVVRISVPISGEYHINFTVKGNDQGVVGLRFITDISGYGGTAFTPYCNNRALATSSIVLFYHGGYYYSGAGTLIYSDLLGTNNNKTQIGGEAKVGYEWVLVSGDYIVDYHPDADSKKSVIICEYYEVV